MSNSEGRRPWGYYEILADEPDHKVKRIVVKSGKRLSLQRHKSRSEHWHIVSGEGHVTLDGKDILLKPGQSIDIPQGVIHRMANIIDGELVFIEVQRGDYFGEDDIERLEDDFGRG
ncbi:MAG: phosphomannose isomerase type II C-terminal cupin domain [bacterium]|nr:phosphomannose isomerase type II C-terminal cupin domain [bacterium]